MEILIYTNYEAEYVTTVKPEQLWRKLDQTIQLFVTYDLGRLVIYNLQNRSIGLVKATFLT